MTSDDRNLRVSEILPSDESLPWGQMYEDLFYAISDRIDIVQTPGSYRRELRCIEDTPVLEDSKWVRKELDRVRDVAQWNDEVRPARARLMRALLRFIADDAIWWLLSGYPDDDDDGEFDDGTMRTSRMPAESPARLL